MRSGRRISGYAAVVGMIAAALVVSHPAYAQEPPVDPAPVVSEEPAEDPAPGEPPVALLSTGKGVDVASADNGGTIASTSAPRDPAAPPENLLDGLSSQWRTASTTTGPQWVRIKLGDGGEVIERVVLSPSTASSSVNAFAIRVSATGPEDADFITVATGELPRAFTTNEYEFPPVRAQYLELRAISNHGSASATTLGGLQAWTRLRDGGDVSLREGPAARIIRATPSTNGSPAVNVIDGTGGYRTPAGAPAEVVVALAGPVAYELDRIRLRSSSNTDAVRRFELLVSDSDAEPASFRSALTGTAARTSSTQEFSFPAVSARYAMLRILDNHGGTSSTLLHELDVVDTDGVNGADGLGVGGVVVRSTSASSDFPGANAIDSSDSTYWQTAAGQNTDQRLTIRLLHGKSHVINRIRLRGSTTSDSPKNIQIRTSNRTAADADFDVVREAVLQPDGMDHWFDLPPTAARYVQLVVVNTYGGSIVRVRTLRIFSPQLGGPRVPFDDLSSDPDSSGLSTEWVFGDGKSSTARHPVHQYEKPGRYNVSLTVRDPEGHADVTESPYEVAKPPSADFVMAPTSIQEGQSVQLTDLTSDLEHGLVSWVWNAGPSTVSQRHPKVTFPDNDDYDVRLTVTNSQQQVDAKTVRIAVVNAPPTVNAGPQRSVFVGQPWMPSPTVTDPGTADQASLVCEWNYGDGTSDRVTECTSTKLRTPHSYSAPGTYTPTLTVTDKDGASTTDSVVVKAVQSPTFVSNLSYVERTDGSVTVGARLYDSFNFAGVAGRLLTLTGSDGTQRAATTNAKGEVSVTFPAAVLSGAMTVQYAGDFDRLPASLTRPLLAPRADVVIALDHSGSMGNAVGAVQNRVIDMAAQLGQTTDFRLGLVGFGVGRAGGPEIHSPLTDDLSAFYAAVEAPRIAGGVEPGFQATVTAMSPEMGGRANAGSCLILVTDEDADITPAWPATRADAVAALKKRKAVFLGVTGPGVALANDYGPNPGSLAAETGGRIFSLDQFISDSRPVMAAILSDCINKVTLPDLTVTITNGVDEVAGGERVTYTVTAANNGVEVATGVAVADELPADVAFVSASDGGAVAGTTVAWPAFSLAPGETVTRTVTVDIGRGIRSTELVNTVRITDDGTHGADRNPNDNVAADRDAVKSDRPPTANAGGPYEVVEGGSVRLDGTASSDPDDDELTLRWDLDGDDVFETAGSTPLFSAANLDGPSRQPVVLEVCDDSGLCDRQSIEVAVTNVAPSVYAGYDRVAFRNEPVPLSATWTDPAQSRDAPYGWSWDVAGSVTQGEAGYGGAITRTTTLPDAGRYSARATVTDKDGAASSDSGSCSRSTTRRSASPRCQA